MDKKSPIKYAVLCNALIIECIEALFGISKDL